LRATERFARWVTGLETTSPAPALFASRLSATETPYTTRSDRSSSPWPPLSASVLFRTASPRVPASVRTDTPAPAFPATSLSRTAPPRTRHPETEIPSRPLSPTELLAASTVSSRLSVSIPTPWTRLSVRVFRRSVRVASARLSVPN
jgi:hypothetical protein